MITIIIGYTQAQLLAMAEAQHVTIDVIVAHLPPDCVHRYDDTLRERIPPIESRGSAAVIGMLKRS